MLTSIYTSPKFWKEHQLTTARKALDRDTPEWRNLAKELLYGEYNKKERAKDAKAYRRIVKKLFAFQVECLEKLGYLFDIESCHNLQSVYACTYFDPEWDGDDDSDAPIEQTNYNEVYELAFQLACLKWCEQNHEYPFVDVTTATIINLSGVLCLDAGNENCKSFTMHSDAVVDSLRSSAISRMNTAGLMYVVIGNMENTFVRTHREIYEAMVAKDAPRLKAAFDAQWK